MTGDQSSDDDTIDDPEELLERIRKRSVEQSRDDEAEIHDEDLTVRPLSTSAHSAVGHDDIHDETIVRGNVPVTESESVTPHVVAGGHDVTPKPASVSKKGGWWFAVAVLVVLASAAAIALVALFGSGEDLAGEALVQTDSDLTPNASTPTDSDPVEVNAAPPSETLPATTLTAESIRGDGHETGSDDQAESTDEDVESAPDITESPPSTAASVDTTATPPTDSDTDDKTSSVEQSPSVSSQPSTTRPPKPSSVMASFEGGVGQIEGSWSASGVVTRWVVEVEGGRLSSGPSAGETSYTWTGVAPGSYRLRVQACNESGCSGPSSWHPVQVINVPSRPDVNLSARGSTLIANWSAQSNGSAILEWEIKDIGTYPASTTSRTWSNQRPDRYSIMVRARNAAGWGPYAPSNTVEIEQRRQVTIRIGGDASDVKVCVDNGWRCVYVVGALAGFGDPPYSVECWISGRKFSYESRSGIVRCEVASGFNQSVYLVVEGVRSNTITVP